METLIKLSCEKFHRFLTPSSGFAFRCYWCKTGGYIKNGYHCTECDLWFHKECNRDELPFKINHTSHPEHLLIRKHIYVFSAYRCNVCKIRIEDINTYGCIKSCSFFLHESCARESPPLTITNPRVHVHQLVFYPISRDKEYLCTVCKEKVFGALAYRCYECEVVIHVECANPPEVNHICHPRHSLKLLTYGAPEYTDNTCLLCGSKFEGVLYHCFLCNFSVCLACVSIQPPVNVEHLKTHEHKLSLLARRLSFTCNACGMQGDRSPYVCLQCDFMVHRSCIGLPHVININRHDHRILHTQQLSSGDQICRICLKSVNRFYGAYSCQVCVDYVVHSLCATRNDVWDGIELEAIPAETEDIKPFKELDGNLINHFSHKKHNLKLYEDDSTHGGSIPCVACMHPVYYEISDPNYRCEQCDFVLHKICANLLLRKRLMLHNKPFTLHGVKYPGHSHAECFLCSACGKFFDGFRYESDNIVLDVSCSLIPEFFFHEYHKHRLHYNKTYIGKCDGCQRQIETLGAFSCESCDYNLDFRCASLPKKIKHICDQHLLSLSCKEKASDEKYWCDICEEEVIPNKGFYACNDCGVNTHVTCVLGEFSCIRKRKMVRLVFDSFEVISNNHSSRPRCSQCGIRCKVPLILKICDMEYFICSERCFWYSTGELTTL